MRKSRYSEEQIVGVLKEVEAGGSFAFVKPILANAPMQPLRATLR